MRTALPQESRIPRLANGFMSGVAGGTRLSLFYLFAEPGPEETKAWTIKKNTNAQDASGVIHSDFQKNFIRAETVSFEDFEKYGGAEKAKENGKLRVEGKDYLVRDGDVLFFRVNV